MPVLNSNMPNCIRTLNGDKVAAIPLAAVRANVGVDALVSAKVIR